MFHIFKSNFISFVLVVVISVTLLPANLQSQPPYEGYVYTYDDNGDRVLRKYSTTLLLKAADTTMTETTVGNFNIRIYPNPTKGQLTLNIAELGRNDKVQMFLVSCIID